MADDRPATFGPADAPAGRVGFGRRFGALIVDLIIISTITWIVRSVTGEDESVHGSGLHDLSSLAQVVAGVGLAVALVQLLYWLIEGLTGASPGKMILKIRIGEAGGIPAAPATLLLRMVIKQINVVAAFLVALTGSHLLAWVGLAGGFIVAIGCFLALGAARQALHDRIVQTAVFYAGTRA